MRELKVGEIIRFRDADYRVARSFTSDAVLKYLLDAHPSKGDNHVDIQIKVNENLSYWEGITANSYGVFSIDQSPLVEKVKSMMDEVKAKMPVIDCTCDIMSNAKVYDGMHAKTCRRR